MNSISSVSQFGTSSSTNSTQKPSDRSSHQEKQYNVKKINKKSTGSRPGGRWTKIELLKYHLFLSHHQRRFEEDQIRRSLRMFKHMSMFLRTRKPSQCRVKHMKNMRKYGSVDGCIRGFVAKTPNFYEKYEKVKQFLLLLDDRAYCGDFQNYELPVKPTLAAPKNQIIKAEVQTPLIEQWNVKKEESQQIKPTIKVKVESMQIIKNEQNPSNGMYYWHPIFAYQPMIFYM